MATTSPPPDPPPMPTPTPPPAPAPQAAKTPDPSKVAQAIQSLSDADRMLLLAALGVPEAQRSRIAKARVDERAAAATEPPLHVRAGIHPIDVEATKAMTGKKAAELVGVDFEKVIGYSVRAPLNVDGEPIGEKAVLTVALNDASKVATEMPSSQKTA